MRRSIHIALAIIHASRVCAFRPAPTGLKLPDRRSPRTPMKAIDPSVAGDIPATAASARGLFGLWFFGGSGGGGIALAQFPKMYARAREISGLGGAPSAGGEGVGVSPLCGLPEDIRLGDLKQILGNKMSVEKMVEKGPKNSYLAECGYLSFDAFQAANPKANPLAVRAVFISITKGSDTVEPDKAQEKFDAYAAGLAAGDGGEAFADGVLRSKVVGYGAIGFLLFLLGIAGTVCVQSIYLGWFPDWPGGQNFPASLIDPGVLSIPQYWI